MIGICYLRMNAPKAALEYFRNVKNWNKSEHDEATYDEAVQYINQLSK